MSEQLQPAPQGAASSSGINNPIPTQTTTNNFTKVDVAFDNRQVHMNVGVDPAIALAAQQQAYAVGAQEATSSAGAFVQQVTAEAAAAAATTQRIRSSNGSKYNNLYASGGYGSARGAAGSGAGNAGGAAYQRAMMAAGAAAGVGVDAGVRPSTAQRQDNEMKTMVNRSIVEDQVRKKNQPPPKNKNKTGLRTRNPWWAALLPSSHLARLLQGTGQQQACSTRII